MSTSVTLSITPRIGCSLPGNVCRCVDWKDQREVRRDPASLGIVLRANRLNPVEAGHVEDRVRQDGDASHQWTLLEEALEN